MLDSLAFLAYMFHHPFGSKHQRDALTLSTPAFKTEHAIPQLYTCEGKKLFIPVNWQHIPKRAKSLALIIFDEDAPPQSRYHFAAYNIKTTTAGVINLQSPKPSFQIAQNSWGEKDYHAPCLANNEHHYVIRLYALNKKLSPQTVNTALQVREAMRHHIIQRIQITGILYPRQENKKTS